MRSARMRTVTVAAITAMAAVSPLRAKVFMTQDEALKAGLPAEAEVVRETAYLTDEQAGRIERIVGGPPASRVIPYYVARKDGSVMATAYFDTHVVRTLPETIMVVIGPKAVIESIHVLSFSEPEEYLPRERWIQQLDGRGSDDDLSLRGDIRPMTGATLSARAIVSAARRILALHEVLAAPSEKSPAEPRENER